MFKRYMIEGSLSDELVRYAGSLQTSTVNDIEGTADVMFRRVMMLTPSSSLFLTVTNVFSASAKMAAVAAVAEVLIRENPSPV